MSDTRSAIMRAGRSAVQARGYNALSFREIGKEIGVKSASIHYHFPTKGDLGAALAQEYTQQGREILEQLASLKTIGAKMEGYVAIFRKALEDENRMCLCGIMAAEQHDLPVEVRTEVVGFTDMNVSWLEAQLAAAHPDGEPSARRERALAIFAAVEGAQLVARGRGEVALFDQAVAAYRRSDLIPR